MLIRVLMLANLQPFTLWRTVKETFDCNTQKKFASRKKGGFTFKVSTELRRIYFTNPFENDLSDEYLSEVHPSISLSLAIEE